ncbi:MULTISPECIES: alpha/beta fold hydrolase [Halorussus]|uniref:alpha/beta fold hydrolase n=1 Tax=Halorussus TaxID=1070314 RepID=UPI0020A0DA74|nr:alpha/beta hydrolase [Halorussus vallis]USZ77634.1 alpha/beta hydrolase [Halorussus vallis]
MRFPETGHLLDRFPYVRVGDGPRTLVVVPGVDDAMFDGEYPVAAGWFARAYFSRFLDDHTVYVLSRPRGLADGTTIADMADDYARALDERLGAADVLGISMGGFVGLELCLRHPELVERLALANSGCRMAGPGLEAVERFLEYTRDRDWARIRAELAAASFTDYRALSYPPLLLSVGRFALPRPADPDDVRISLEAIEAFDVTDRLGDVDSPTLVFGGAADPYFPEPILAETVAGIPDAELASIPGAKHGAFHERKPEFDDRLAALLDRPTHASERSAVPE